MDQFIGTLEGLDNQTNRNLGIKLNAGYGDIVLGGSHRGGDIDILDDAGNIRIRTSCRLPHFTWGLRVS
jgi:hypothetical protein